MPKPRGILIATESTIATLLILAAMGALVATTLWWSYNQQIMAERQLIWSMEWAKAYVLQSGPDGQILVENTGKVPIVLKSVIVEGPSGQYVCLDAKNNYYFDADRRLKPKEYMVLKCNVPSDTKRIYLTIANYRFDDGVKLTNYDPAGDPKVVEKIIVNEVELYEVDPAQLTAQPLSYFAPSVTQVNPPGGSPPNAASGNSGSLGNLPGGSPWSRPQGVAPPSGYRYPVTPTPNYQAPNQAQTSQNNNQRGGQTTNTPQIVCLEGQVQKVGLPTAPDYYLVTSDGKYYINPLASQMVDPYANTGKTVAISGIVQYGNYIVDIKSVASSCKAISTPTTTTTTPTTTTSPTTTTTTRLSTTTGSGQSCFEGYVMAYVVDYFTKGYSETYYFLMTKDGKTYKLDLSSAQILVSGPFVGTGRPVAVYGTLVGDTIKATSVASGTCSGSPPPTTTTTTTITTTTTTTTSPPSGYYVTVRVKSPSDVRWEVRSSADSVSLYGSWYGALRIGGSTDVLHAAVVTFSGNYRDCDIVPWDASVRNGDYVEFTVFCDRDTPTVSKTTTVVREVTTTRTTPTATPPQTTKLPQPIPPESFGTTTRPPTTLTTTSTTTTTTTTTTTNYCPLGTIDTGVSECKAMGGTCVAYGPFGCCCSVPSVSGNTPSPSTTTPPTTPPPPPPPQQYNTYTIRVANPMGIGNNPYIERTSWRICSDVECVEGTGTGTVTIRASDPSKIRVEVTSCPAGYTCSMSNPIYITGEGYRSYLAASPGNAIPGGGQSITWAGGSARSNTQPTDNYVASKSGGSSGGSSAGSGWQGTADKVYNDYQQMRQGTSNAISGGLPGYASHAAAEYSGSGSSSSSNSISDTWASGWKGTADRVASQSGGSGGSSSDSGGGASTQISGVAGNCTDGYCPI